jgi:putative hydrolase of the HAD superfamily
MAHNLWEHVPADVVPALEALRARGLTLAVASNANGVLQRMFDRVGLTPYFHAVCDSCIEGVEKPDPRFFRIVLQRCGGQPDTAVHIGDLYHVDVEGARAAGVRPLLLDPHGLYVAYPVERITALGQLVEMLA